MKSSTDPKGFRHSLLALLEADPPQEDKLLASLERHRDDGRPLYSAALYILTHLSFSEPEARRHWASMQAHRAALRETLGREAGLRVALLDYFVNVNRELKSPKVIEISIYERTARSAVMDGLTGLYNHAYFVQALGREIQRARRHQLQVSLAFLDLDDFKRLNDTRGHVAGDRVLVKASALIADSLREIDVAARYGGEEFAVILPETSRNGAFVVADRMRLRLEEHFRRRRGALGVTLSGGVATYPDDAADAEGLVRRADEALYRSKADGKNRISLVQGERRRHLRLPVSHPVTLRGAAVRRASARTRNVSEGGFLVSLREPVPLGSHLNVLVRAAGRPPLGLWGEVVRVEKTAAGRAAYDIGVRFLCEPAESRPLLVLRRPVHA